MGKGMTGKVVSVCGSCSRFIFACLEVNVYHFPRDWPNTGLSTQPLNDRVSLLYLFHCYVRLNRMNIWFIFRECNSFWEYQLIPFRNTSVYEILFDIIDVLFPRFLFRNLFCFIFQYQNVSLRNFLYDETIWITRWFGIEC